MSRPNEVEPPVLAAVRGGVGTLTLNRPASINALDHEMVARMSAVLQQWAADPGVRAVVVAGAGERGLCAGGDVVAIHRDAAALAGAGDEALTGSASAAFWRDEYRMNADIAEYPKPYVAIMDGIVMGGGVGISGHANTRIVTDRTRLAMPEVGIGLVPDVGGTWLLSQVPDQLGTFAALTSVHLRGADAIALGLADHYVPADRLDEFRAALAERALDEALAEFAVTPPVSELAAQRDWIAGAFAADTVAQIVENCRAAGRPEADEAADTIAGKSPTALAVTLAALHAAATEGSLREALRREYRTSVRCLAHPDLAEGIRAQVIDKDRTPAWRPAGLDRLTGDEAAAFLAPLPAGRELTYPQN